MLFVVLVLFAIQLVEIVFFIIRQPIIEYDDGNPHPESNEGAYQKDEGEVD